VNGQLVFDDRFGKRTEREQIDYLKKLAGSQNHALDLMQKERDMWRDKCQLAEQQLNDAEQAFIIQKNISRNAIEQHNADSQQNHERIAQLERKIGELGGTLD